MDNDRSRWQRALARISTWAEDEPANLAIFRVAVGVALLLLPDLHEAARWASLPDAVRTAPVGLGWVTGTIPITPTLAVAAHHVVVVAGTMGVLGLFSRTSFLVVTIAGLYILGIPQFAGAAFHYHHLVWFTALLAASPCGDALSIDRLLRRRRGVPPPGRHLAYGIPLRVGWILVGVIFFFPGLHKLLTSGWAWVWSDNLRNQMYAKWLQKPEFVPLFRVDHYPTLVNFGALFTVAFELAFVWLVLFRRTRPWAVLAAMLFHQLTAALMGLRFSALWLCYVMFIDWQSLGTRITLAWTTRASLVDFIVRSLRRASASASASEPEPESESASDPPHRRAPPVRTALVVGAFLLVGTIGFGAAGESDGWPFACYPKFHRLVSAHLPALAITLVHEDGTETPVPIEWVSPGGRTQRWWALSWSLLGAHERARRDLTRFQTFWARASHSPHVREAARDATEVRFYRDVMSTIPEERDVPPLEHRLVCRLHMRPPEAPDDDERAR